MSKQVKRFFQFSIVIISMLLVFTNCKKDDDSEPEAVSPTLNLSAMTLDFGNVVINTISESQTIVLDATNLTQDVVITASTEQYEISEDDNTFAESITFTAQEANDASKTIYIRFNPKNQTLGSVSGTLTVANTDVGNQTVTLNGESVIAQESVINIQTFNNARHAFGSGLSQSQTGTFQFPEDMTQIQNIKMYIQLECPAGDGCNAWDVFSNISVKNPANDTWHEIGRYITPYGVDNHQLERGFEIDVTDFKSLLTGTVELRSFIEVWGSDGWNVSVDFDVTLGGEIEYPYSSITEIIQYNAHSLAGIPYGVDHDFDLDKNITIPVNAENTSLRTIITGWGHATPADSNGRPCAEWCYRTHDVLINGAPAFQHNMGPIGCGTNPVQPQGGNWQPNRAGWCPGMAVPNRIDQFDTTMAGQTFNFTYDLEDWTSNSAGTNNAYYAISTFAVVKSNTPIEAPSVTD